MLIVRGDAQTLPSELNKAATGEVWFDPIFPKTDGVDVGTVVFSPNGRTVWHQHEHGQLLQIAYHDHDRRDRVPRGGDGGRVRCGERHPARLADNSGELTTAAIDTRAQSPFTCRFSISCGHGYAPLCAARPAPSSGQSGRKSVRGSGPVTRSPMRIRPGRMMSHQTPKVMSFLPRSRASACRTRASVVPESGFLLVTTQRGTGAMTPGSGGQRQLAVLPDDQELTIAYYAVLPEPDLAGGVQPHALDRRDGQLGNGDRHSHTSAVTAACS
jgi:hypothetical protein